MNAPTRIALSTAMALLAPAMADAMHLNPRGLGQVLIYPYYTTHVGNASLLSVVNTTRSTKALKLRFREALNGRSVLDINLYLGPFDVWTGAVVAADEAGPAILVSDDRSCTVPELVDGVMAFSDANYTGSFDDDGPNALSRTREGFIELIEMGVVEDNTPDFNIDTSFFDAAEHNDGTPQGCSILRNAWAADGIWQRNATVNALNAPGGVTTPTGGLYGGLVIANVADGISFSYQAEAIAGFYQLAETRLHTPPGSRHPDLTDAETVPGEVMVQVALDERISDLRFVAGRPDAVSALFMATGIHNQFDVSPELGAVSEWVITHPTKHLHLEQPTPARRRPFTDNVDDSDAGGVSPAGNALDNDVYDPEGSCVSFGGVIFDRESGPEALMPTWFDPGFPRMCYQANVLSWHQAPEAQHHYSPLLGSAALVEFGLDAGRSLLLDASGHLFPRGHAAWEWGRREFVERTEFLLDGHENAGASPRTQLFGLPAVGFWVAAYTNSGARPGVLANYATVLRHYAALQVRSVLVTNEGEENERIEPTNP